MPNEKTLNVEKHDDYSLKLTLTETKVDSQTISLDELIEDKDRLQKQRVEVIGNLQKEIVRFDNMIAEINSHIERANELGVKLRPKGDKK